MPSYITSEQQDIIDYALGFNSNIGSIAPMPEVLGLCDVCNKLEGESLLGHLENHHPNFLSLILMTEKVMKIKQQIKEDNSKPEVHVNRLDSVED